MAGPSLARRRAGAALTAIQDLAAAAGVKAQEKEAYAGYVKGVPASIVMIGLGQTMAAQLAQGGKDTGKGQGGQAPNAHRQIYLHLEQWLCGGDPESPFEPPPSDAARGRWLMQQLCAASEETYLIAQAEALAYLEWLKKFANAFLTVPEAGNASDGQTA